MEVIVLSLTRKVGERIFIDHGSVIVTVLHIGKEVVRLGIAAPSDVSINREEVELRINPQQKEA